MTQLMAIMKEQLWRRLWAGLTLTVLAAASWGSTPLTIDVSDGEATQLSQIYEWHDSGATTEFHALPDHGSQWTLRPVRHPANTRGTTWIRFNLLNNSETPRRYIISLDEAFIEDVQLYQALSDGSIHHQRSGLVIPLSDRPIRTRMPAFEVTVEPKFETQFTLSYRSKFEAVLGLQILPSNQFARWADWQSSLYMLFFGCAMAILVFNLLLFLALRDTLYLIYVGHILCVIGFIVRFSGFDLYFITTPEGHYRLGIISWLQAMLLIEFARRLLDVKALSRQLDWLLKSLMLITALLALATLINIDFYSVGIRFSMPMLLILLATGIYSMLQGNVLGRFLVLAQTPYIFGYLFLAGASTGLLAPTLLNRYGFILGSVFELLMFSLALGYRVRQLVLEKQRSQEDYLQLQTSLKEQLQEQVDAQTLDLQQATSQLRGLTADYSSLLNNIDTGIASLSNEGTVLFANRAFEELSQTIPSLTKDILAHCEEQQFSHGTAEVSIEDARGTVRHLLLKLHARNTQEIEQRGKWVVVADITELRSQQAQLNHSAKMATLGAMSTGMAHELNQPLNAIRLGLQNIKRGVTKGLVEQDVLVQRLERIDEQVSRAAKLITHMRTFGRVSQDAFEPFELETAIVRATDLLNEQLRLEQIDLELPNTGEDKHYAMGDGLQFEQVMINLVNNARDAINQHGGIRRITVNLERAGNNHYVTIEDTGGGIPAEYLDRIFEPFFTTKEVGQGTGLGGSISYGIIKDMQGDIRATNTSNGVRITIQLPALDHEMTDSQRGDDDRL